MLVALPLTGTSHDREVTATWVHDDEPTRTELSFADGSTLAATDWHPVWVADLDRWVPIAEVRAGSWLRAFSGTWVQVTAVRHFTDEGTAHDLTVEHTHTYHVLAGASPLLVHNCGDDSGHLVGKGDDPLVPELVEDINARYPGHVKAQGIDINGPDGKTLTDFDIVTDNAVVQVKSGTGKGALEQAQKTQGLTDYPVIVYVPQARGSVVKGLEKAGIMVTRDKETLLQVLRP